MNISSYSPVLTLLYVFALLWILMGIDPKSFSKTQRWLVPLLMVLLCTANQFLRELFGHAVFGKLLLFCMHLPTFFLFLYIGKRGVIKTAFMILTAVVFTAPTVLIGNLVRRTLFVDAPQVFLLFNLISCGLMLLLALLVFRNVFTYLLIYGDNRLFLIFSLVPVLYYVYVLASIDLDLTALTSFSGYLTRFLPTVEVFLCYFMLPYIYKTLHEKQAATSAQTALRQKLASTEDQIALLNETNQQMAIYRHDMRHQLLMLEGLIANGKTEQVQEFIKNVMEDLDAITPKQYCENETVNLLCSSYERKARQLNVRLTIHALLPEKIPLSDTELCSVVSNGLENALQAASQSELSEKWVKLYCEVKQNKLLIQIRNPYAGEVVIRNGLPVASREGHGYGCHSIQTIVQRNGGHCTFVAEAGMFTLRLILPLRGEK